MYRFVAAGRTLFPDQAVISIIRVVGIPGYGAASIADDTEIELQEFVAKTTRVAGTVGMLC